jgi:competence ComEA-like helix-hairpin-helix protein
LKNKNLATLNIFHNQRLCKTLKNHQIKYLLHTFLFKFEYLKQMMKKLALYFFYTRSERNGVFILIAFTLAILTFPKLYATFRKPSEAIDFTDLEKAIIAFDHSKATDTEGGSFENGKSNIALFGFNPNTASLGELTQLGLSSRTATTLIHYRERGGQFRRKEDLKKVYGMTSANYDRLKEYIELDNDMPSWATKGGNKTGFREGASFGNIPQRAVILKPFDPNTATESDLLGLGLEEKTVKNLLKYREKKGIFYKKEDLKKLYMFSEIDFIRIEKFIQIADNQNIVKVFPSTETDKISERKQNTPIDVNAATQADWLQLRGIGATFASRIITQREKLGGFATSEQLKEVYGLPDSTLQNIAPYLKLTTLVYRKLRINKATPDAITHPYLTRKQAESLVRYRQNHGEFKTINDIKQTGIFSDANLEKLRPYVSFD